MSERWAISDISVTPEANGPNKNIKPQKNKNLPSWCQSYIMSIN